MKTLPGLAFLRKGSELPGGTATAAFAADRENVLGGADIDEETQVRFWLGGPSNARVREQTIGLGTYGKCLTVLSSSTIGQEEFEDETDEEANLIDSWTPKFRR
jgi:hypothetical protein